MNDFDAIIIGSGIGGLGAAGLLANSGYRILMLERLPFLDFEKHAKKWMMRSFRKDWPGYRARPGDDMPQETSIVNLHNVGDSVKPSGVYGVGACAESARRVVKKIQEKHLC